MLQLRKIHHIAIICIDYQKSKEFYTQILGLTIKQETYRPERNSYKLDLCLNNEYIIELFSFPNPPNRPSKPEALVLRHLAFEVANIEKSKQQLIHKNIAVEPIRIDSLTHKKFTFFNDPDGLPIELYEN
ncbi:SMU1112c/YaeR family gloxylase I-like metalloprotein [Wenyingzhuangia aestuarii]|uniref:SMU1112c/YaeR family gloxylase I-like metalloprotein n=1 Tax=Wenyingzhuangia aestuarii TaxID=1647582 RepID=UPI0014396F67|nr:VOC family protein [Wenyingzhuangia aestuarii]NJB82364.1 glyoxylase I family protein [Wenyingzhuangia aestuarii]